MRFVFEGTDHPSALAKSIKKSLARHGSPLGLRRCENLLAEMTGYANWHELRKVALSGEPRSPRDHDVAPDVASARRTWMLNVLVRRTEMTSSEAGAVLDEVAITGRRAAAASDEEAFNRGFGVVMFDTPEDPGPAWMAIAGAAQPARRISGPHELSTSVVWWTNVGYEHFFRGPGAIWRNPWLRHDKYLVVNQAGALVEWGHDPKTLNAGFVARFAADIFGRIMTIAYGIAQKADPKLRMDRFFEGRTLCEDLRRLIPEAEYPEGDAASMMRSRATRDITSTTTRMPKGGKFILLRVPRGRHCRDMLQTPVPVGPWEHLSRTETSDADPATTKMPMMAKVAVSGMPAEAARIYGPRTVRRAWLAHPELALLERFGRIEVADRWRGREYASLMQALPKAVKDFMADEYTDASWSAGVVAESLWRAVALPQEKLKAGAGDSGEKPHTSWRGAWIEAADKSAMFLEAMRLAELGHAVSSYGFGWFLCSVPEQNVRRLIGDAFSLGLYPPILAVPEDMCPGGRMPVKWGGGARSEGQATDILTRSRTFLWNIDRIASLPEKERGPAMLKLAEFRQRNGI